MNIITHAQRMFANYRYYDIAAAEMLEAAFKDWETAFADGFDRKTPAQPNAEWYMQAYKEGEQERTEQEHDYEQFQLACEYQAELDEAERQARESEYQEYIASRDDWHTLQPEDKRTVADLEATGYTVKYFENTGYNVEETWRRYEDAPTYISLSEKTKLAHAVWL
jgi:hypothetical protein